MRKGLTATLMTVAIALLAVQAMAMAPVIGDVPSPIVGNADVVTGVTGYVFQDALNINGYVSDDSTAPSAILWSYSIAGSAHYAINGVPALAGGDDPITPPSGKVFNTQVLNGESNLDSNPATITVRNTNFSPLGGGTGATPPASGLTDIQTVTLFASDGSTYSQTSIFFYTDANGTDRLSPGSQGTVVFHDVFSSAATRSGYTFGNIAGITASDATGSAICLNSPMVGNNMGLYYTPYGKIALTANSVYRLRATMSGSNATAGSTPFWDFVVDNTDGTQGFNAYGADFMFFDNLGGAESVISTPKIFDVYFCPPAVGTTRWNDTSVASGAGSSLFSTGNATMKDARVIFRVLDVNSNPGITADSKSGSICMTDLLVEKFDLGTFPVVTDAGNYSNTAMSASNMAVANFGGATVAFSSNTAVVTPSAVTCLVQVAPGNADVSTPTERQDNYPVPWADQTLYKVTVSMNGGSTPPGVYWLGADSAGSEIIGQSYSTNAGFGSGMPQAGASQDFVLFMYGNFQGTGGSPVDSSYVRLRPWIMIGGNTAFAGGTGANGVVNVTAIKMEKVAKPL